MAGHRDLSVALFCLRSRTAKTRGGTKSTRFATRLATAEAMKVNTSISVPDMPGKGLCYARKSPPDRGPGRDTTPRESFTAPAPASDEVASIHGQFTASRVSKLLWRLEAPSRWLPAPPWRFASCWAKVAEHSSGRGKKQNYPKDWEEVEHGGTVCQECS